VSTNRRAQELPILFRVARRILGISSYGLGSQTYREFGSRKTPSFAHVILAAESRVDALTQNQIRRRPQNLDGSPGNIQCRHLFRGS
jgi:hypothetical protein